MALAEIRHFAIRSVINDDRGTQPCLDIQNGLRSSARRARTTPSAASSSPSWRVNSIGGARGRRSELQLPAAPDHRQGQGREHAQGQHRARDQARRGHRRRWRGSWKRSPTRATARTAWRSSCRPSPTTATAPSPRSAGRSRAAAAAWASRAAWPGCSIRRATSPSRWRVANQDKIFELALEAGAEDVQFGEEIGRNLHPARPICRACARRFRTRKLPGRRRRSDDGAQDLRLARARPTRSR